jgi:chromosome segregation ATPase
MENDRLDVLARLERGEITPEEAAGLLSGDPPAGGQAAAVAQPSRSDTDRRELQQTLAELLERVRELESSVNDIGSDVGDVSSRLEDLRARIEEFRAKVARLRSAAGE